jgi:hypothetical protein
MRTAEDYPMDKLQRRIGELEDQLKAKDRRIEELRLEVDELRDLTRRMSEHADDYVNSIEAWKETFEMQLGDDGKWTNAPWWDEHNELVDNYNDLVRRWNRYLHLIRQQPVGRPLGASEAQVAQVRKLRKAGKSLRWIAEELNLGVHTVRTIVGKQDGTDRTSKKHRDRLGRIEVDRKQLASWNRQKRTGDSLPRRAQAVVEEGRALLKEAKGLGR